MCNAAYSVLRREPAWLAWVPRLQSTQIRKPITLTYNTVSLLMQALEKLQSVRLSCLPLAVAVAHFHTYLGLTYPCHSLCLSPSLSLPKFTTTVRHNFNPVVSILSFFRTTISHLCQATFTITQHSNIARIITVFGPWSKTTTTPILLIT
jgi:hypothetical protein